MKNIPWAKVYLFLLLLLLPLDWFSPTGTLFREFGAKPAILLMSFGSVVIFLEKPLALLRVRRSVLHVALQLWSILAFGALAFCVNLIFSWSTFNWTKNPIFQFLSQAAMFASFAIVVISHAVFFSERKWRDFLVTVLPSVALIQLSVLVLEASGTISAANGWLSLFHTHDAEWSGQPSGLMSEPSYFGAFAAMYGFPLFILPGRFWHKPLALMLFGASILIRARTFVPVILAECAILFWMRGRKVLSAKTILLIVVLAAASSFVIVSYAALDLNNNMSSAMRIGSTTLALNISAHGYSLSGVGFGQFHFFYLDKFAPQFLMASNEAISQMDRSTEMRASTYNLFARLLVETGVAGLVVFLSILFCTLSSVRENTQASATFATLIVAGSVGFLLTQDTYFYPPLATGLALLLGCASDAGSTIQNRAKEICYDTEK